MSLDGHEVIYLGYSIWWGKAPRLLCTFVEGCNLSGKTIVPFCTSGTSDIGTSADELTELSSATATWLPGKHFAAGRGERTVAQRLDSLPTSTLGS